MLEYLVTSRVRRRLLILLWAEHVRGSATELAERAGVAFAGVHAELKEMYALRLVRSDRSGGAEVFFANLDHPHAELLAKLVATPVTPLPSERADDLVRRQLVALGAPLRGVPALEVARDVVLASLVAGAKLARRDPVVARSLPLCVWKSRDRVDASQLHALSLSPEEKHTVAFFLELTAELGGDRRLLGLAEGLRDHRLTSRRPFFPSANNGAPRDFPLAAKWGFDINMDLESFRALFAKFADA